MNQMFKDNPSFNQDISAWNVGAVTDMSQMFEEASSFNQQLCWGITLCGDDWAACSSASVNTYEMFTESSGCTGEQGRAQVRTLGYSSHGAQAGA